MLLPIALRAQATGERVDGVVYDSLDRRPLANATVQIVSSPAGHGAYAAMSDSLGRFHIDDVRAGSYVAGFLHPRLDTLGILAATKSVIVGEGAAHLSLAIPSAATITRAICATPATSRKASSDSTGLLVGHVFDGVTGATLGASSIVLDMPTLVFGGNTTRSEVQHVRVHTNDDGWFAMCGLEADDYQVHAEHGTRATGTVDITIGPRAITTLSLVLGAEGATPGATLTGTVTAPGGHPLEGAQVGVDGSEVTTTTDAEGAFTLASVPDGSRMAEARVLGYLPKRVPVTPSRGETRRVSIVMAKRAQELNTVTVFGKPSWKTRDFTGFQERRKKGFGHFITREQIAQTNDVSICDLLSRVPGVTVSSNGGIGCSARLHAMVTGVGGGVSACEPKVYMDNLPFNGSVTEFTRSYSPRDIMGIEIYSASTQPIQYQGGCGSLVVWTR
ncbi:MAG: carboxypeptidase regulatory-like domain-containing protein [Gemmatimonadaceae bacterium]